MLRLVIVLFAALSFQLVAFAETFNLSPGDSIQNTIDSAVDGDSILLEEGVYDGELDFSGKNISIVGQGRRTIIRGDGEGPVVTFNSGESFSALLDQVRISGGKDEGAILIQNSSPRVNRSWIVNNRSLDKASGILVINGSPAFFNNVIVNNRKAKGGLDPHQVFIEDASPNFVNNTIVRGDSNGIFITGSSNPRISNSIIAFNGSGKKGRAICIIGSPDGVRLDYNLFFRNRIGDIFAPGFGGDFNIEDFQALDTLPAEFNITENINANPRFRNLRKLRGLRLRKNSAAIDAGDPDSLFNDLDDNSRNDIGAGGGLFPVF